jgi:hypothetical protein
LIFTRPEDSEAEEEDAKVLDVPEELAAEVEPEAVPAAEPAEEDTSPSFGT